MLHECYCVREMLYFFVAADGENKLQEETAILVLMRLQLSVGSNIKHIRSESIYPQVYVDFL